MEFKVILANPSAMQVISTLRSAVAKSPTGVSFLSVRYYTNKQGEVSHYSINVGAKYENAVIRDIEFLRNLNPFEYKWKSSMKDIMTAQAELLASFENPNKTRSQGQKDAFEHIGSGLKVHNETGALYVFGYLKSKKVLKEGEKKSKNSAALTIAKDEIRKHLRTGKFRQFVLDTYHIIKANKESLFIEYPPVAVAYDVKIKN